MSRQRHISVTPDAHKYAETDVNKAAAMLSSHYGVLAEERAIRLEESLQNEFSRRVLLAVQSMKASADKAPTT